MTIFGGKEPPKRLAKTEGWIWWPDIRARIAVQPERFKRSAQSCGITMPDSEHMASGTLISRYLPSKYHDSVVVIQPEEGIVTNQTG